MNTPTPETDAEIKYDDYECGLSRNDESGEWIKSDFARKLERERDEARKQIPCKIREQTNKNNI
jgi:hypothetical protein